MTSGTFTSQRSALKICHCVTSSCYCCLVCLKCSVLKRADVFSHGERQGHPSPKFAWASVRIVLHWEVEGVSCTLLQLLPHTCHFEGVGKPLSWAVFLIPLDQVVPKHCGNLVFKYFLSTASGAWFIWAFTGHKFLCFLSSGRYLQTIHYSSFPLSPRSVILSNLCLNSAPISTSGYWSCLLSNFITKLHKLKALQFRNDVHLPQCLIQDSLLSPEFYFADSALLVAQLFLCWYLERNKRKLSWIYSSLLVLLIHFLQLSLSLKCHRWQLGLLLFFKLLDTLLSVARNLWIN